MSLKTITASAATIFLISCGGSGGSGTSNGSLPNSAINFDTADVGLRETTEQLVSQSQPVLSDPTTVTYPYDPADPDSETPTDTDVEIRTSCTTKTYDVKSNPEKVILHGVDNAITWPGAFLQGKQYREGSLRGLNIAEGQRAPVTVTITRLFNNSGASSSRTVEVPNFANVDDAVKDIIVQSYNDDIPIGDSVAYSYEETKDVSRFMLKSGISAKYGIASGSLSAGIDNSSSSNTIIINLLQNLFEVEVSEPASKDAWFTDSFYSDGLPQKIAGGEISDDNPPVYVSKVIYGRMLTSTMSSTASSSELEAMMKASVNTLIASGSLSLTTKQEKIHESKKVEMVSIGGNGATALTAAFTGDWGAYFKENLKLTEAVPIAMEFKNLHDNSPAGATEAGEYTEEVCTPQLVMPGPYDFSLEDAHTLPAEIGTIHQVVMGNFDGDEDGRQDLVWNHLAGNENKLYVGYGAPEGRFDIQELACSGSTCDYSDRNVPWGQYTLSTGDFNADGRSDLLWFRDANGGIDYYMALASDDGFESTLRQQSVPDTYISPTKFSFNPPATVIIEDMNNDGADDIIRYYIASGGDTPVMWDIMYQIAVANSDSLNEPFVIGEIQQFGDRLTENLADTDVEVSVGDINSDGWMDLIQNVRGQFNVARWSLNTANTQSPTPIFDDTLIQSFTHEEQVWPTYKALFDDFDGDRDVDIAWIKRSAADAGAVHQAAYDPASNQFEQRPLQRWESSADDPYEVTQMLIDNEKLFVIDANGDSAMDVLVNKYFDVSGEPNSVNVIALMRGRKISDGLFNNLATDQQVHPVHQNWQFYTYVFVGDVNGDGLDDITWNNAALVNGIYTAFAKLDLFY